MGQLEQSGFKRMEHPTYSPDLAPWDLFGFSYMKEQLKGRSFAEEEELLSVLSELMSPIPLDFASLCRLESKATGLSSGGRGKC
jgi:hypothetical protein